MTQVQFCPLCRSARLTLRADNYEAQAAPVDADLTNVAALAGLAQKYGLTPKEALLTLLFQRRGLKVLVQHRDIRLLLWPASCEEPAGPAKVVQAHISRIRRKTGAEFAAISSLGYVMTSPPN